VDLGESTGSAGYVPAAPHNVFAARPVPGPETGPDQPSSIKGVTPSALAAAIIDAVARAVAAGDLSVPVPTEVTVERPRVREHGDYATNAAMKLAKPAGRPPREVAEIIAAQLRETDGIAKVEVAGPGFLNIRLTEGALGGLVKTIIENSGYGHNDALAGQRINLEFVSANPTGPLHIGGVRWAAVGDALARILEASGAQVTREYYFNDAGAQIDRFANSLYAAARGEPTPEDGYAGAYIGELAAQVVRQHPDVLEQSPEEAKETFRASGIELMFGEIKQKLAEFGVRFDVYTNEGAFHSGGELERAIATLREQGHTYESDGALWLRTTDFGDDKDRVLLRSDGGRPTYFAADAAYYLNKRGRGFDKVLMILGADHHGYIGRLRAIAACAGDDPDRTLEVLIGQLVNLSRGGEAVRMSKRAGQVVGLDDLVDAVGVDAGRYALARTSMDSTIDIDLDLWSRRAPENPVFYVQYAHSRMASVRRNAAELGIDYGEVSTVDLTALGSERETDLLRALGEFPRVVAAAAELRGPHRIARYAEELAGHWHRFYESCRILPYGDEPVTPLNIARLWLAAATQQVLASALDLLGVSAPERM
jgi:arginyl-tRNA synthetase